jgi:hypothetical protein
LAVFGLLPRAMPWAGMSRAIGAKAVPLSGLMCVVQWKELIG